AQTCVDRLDGSVRRQSCLLRESVRRCENTWTKQVNGIRTLQVVAFGTHIASPDEQISPYVPLHRQIPLLDLRIPQALVYGANGTEAAKCGSKRANRCPASLNEGRCPCHHICERIRTGEICSCELVHEGWSETEIRNWIQEAEIIGDSITAANHGFSATRVPCKTEARTPV